MAATFPAGLYSHGASQQDATLTQGEWNQVGFEVEALEAALGTNPHASTAMGRTYASVDARLEDIEGFIAAFGQTGLRALVIAPNAGAPNSALDVTADLLAVGGKIALNLSKTASIATYTGGASTVNGRDFAGSPANNTWYYLHAIWNPTSDSVDTLWSASATAPTLPSGYTRARRIGCGRTDGSGNLLRVQQQDRRVQYRDPALITLTWVTTWTTLSLATAVPPPSRVGAITGWLLQPAATAGAALYVTFAGAATGGALVVSSYTTVAGVAGSHVFLASAMLNASQQLDYKMGTAAAAGQGIIIYCAGYEDPI